MEKGASADMPVTPDLSGRTLGDFRIIRSLGQGGMGQVYLAEQCSLKRPVALKILRSDLAANPVSLRRFQAEAEAVARVTHANIVQVYAIGQADGLHFMALEYVEGRNLRDHLSRKGVPDLPLALSILTQVTAALQRAAESGIVHRDIKPENILLTRQGEVKVADFGLSRCLAADREPLHLTQTGVSLGTPLYMSPEQVQGGDIDPRTDIYSLGVTAYQMLCGEAPFRGHNAFDVAVQHVQKDPEPLASKRPDLPAEVGAVIHKMMAKKPDDRYQSARELLAELTELRDRLGGSRVLPLVSISQPMSLAMAEPVSARRRWLWVAALSLLPAFALGLGYRWLTAEPVGTEAALHANLGPSPAQMREKALRAAVEQPFDFRKPDEAAAHFRQTIELGMLYLEQRRLKEAQAYFESLRDQPQGLRLHHAFGRIGLACVLAFQDQAKESMELFTELERLKPPRPVFKISKVVEYPEYIVLHLPEVRRLVAEALSHNATNLGVNTLPEPLERLRRPLPMKN
jgi:serine/threonine-protein kinase